MEPTDSKPPGTAVSRLKERIFQGWSSREPPAQSASHPVPAIAPQRQVGFPARIAEFLLVFRLRARRRSALSADILEHAVRVVFVTCKHWFGGGDPPAPRPRRHD
ncbi:MAG: hypothetical protein JWP79_2903 [Polaromonas sp.]|jgi:hypothetical protein|nr:hypothetical protein [Polaromonas sp.]MDB5845593.1 hypothetical protein [Polaromonas sp.]MDB5938722.1 hypothetical protein [Polaromonas sp.]